MTGWTPAQVLEAYTRHHDGASNGEIAREMGMTRNSVCGYFDRHPPPPVSEAVQRERKLEADRKAVEGLSRIAQQAWSDPTPAPQAATPPPPPPKPPKEPEPLALPPEPRPTITSVSLFRERATNPCCWPLGDPARPDFRYCGDAAHGGKPYCPPHDILAHPPRQPASLRTRPTTRSAPHGQNIN